MEVYIVGKYILGTDVGAVWEFMGIFEKEEDAVEACIEDNYFVAPAPLNENLSKDTIEWPGVYYPSERD